MWLTALMLGLAGSLHCAGMCSPLAVAVTRLSKPVLVNKFLYNGGRILTYGVMGLFAGVIGGVFDLSVFQKFFSLVIGAGLIVIGVSGLQTYRIPLLTPAVVKTAGYVKQLFGKVLSKKSKVAVLFLGFLNGMLPCGLTYLALAYSITANGPMEGFLYMVVFGLGTVPVMVGLPLMITPLTRRFNLSFRKINTALFIGIGLFLLARNYIHLPMGSDPSSVVEIVDPICR